MSARVAVIGGGLAGLSAALRLASRGAAVTLFERRRQLGGKAGEVRFDGFRFDTGPTLVTLPRVIAETFAAAPAAAPALVPLDPLVRCSFASGLVWDVRRDPALAAAGLAGRQPAAYRRVLAEARALFEAAAPTFVHGPRPGAGALLRYGLRHGASAHPFATLPQLLRRRGAEQELMPFFLRFATYAGADPYRSPAVLLNIAWAELGLGAYWVRGGVHALALRLREAAQAAGAQLHPGVEVERLEVAGGRVRAVRSAAGRLAVDAVVSAVDRATSLRLLGRGAIAGRGEASLSGFVLLLGVHGGDPTGAHHNVVFPRDYAAEFAALRKGRLPSEPTLYVSVSARSEPGDAPAGHENWFVMVNAPPLAEAAGRDPLASALPELSRAAAAGLPQLRDVDGEAVTPSETLYAGHLIAELERRAGFDRRRLRTWRLLGPRQLAVTGERGSIYGRAPVGLLRTLRPAPRLAGVRNLALAGGTVHPGGGIPLVLLSGRHAADAVLAVLE